EGRKAGTQGTGGLGGPVHQPRRVRGLMRVVILTPWRTDHNRREAIYRHVRAQQESLGLPIYTADSGHSPFNICASWNRASDRPWDVALFWGADFTLTDPTTALDAVVEAAK